MAEGPRFRPDAWGFQGVVLAHGLLWPVLREEHALRTRVIALWQPGCVLLRQGSLRALRLPEPRRLRATEAPGGPLVLQDGLLCAAPGLAPEARRRGATDGSIVWLHRGELRVLLPGEGEPEDLTSWLALEDLTPVHARGLSMPPRPLPPEPVLPVTRALFGPRIPPLSERAQALAAEFQAPTPAPAPTPPPVPPPAVIRGLAGLFQFLSTAITRAVLAPSPASRAAVRSAADGKDPPPGLVVRPVAPSGPGLFQRMARRLDDWAARLLMATQLAPLAGRKQAEYLESMMDLFARGSFEEALRHAIPLGGSGGGSPSFSLGIPGPRDQLALSAGPASNGTSILPFHGLHDELKRIYTEAFGKLDAQGKVEEAAFVLAELLQQSEQAVAYLERHGLFRIAAELAEGRGLPPGQVVRQWFLAGDWQRGVQVARRHHAFRDALTRLEQGSPELARGLRIFWADQLASGGHFLDAEQLLEDLPEARATRLAWLEQAGLRGGDDALRAMLRRLALEPGYLEQAARNVQRLCDPREEARTRLMLAELMMEKGLQGRPPSLVALARPLLRALLVDTAGRAEPDTLTRLRATLADPLLALEWPRPPAGGLSEPSCLTLELPAVASAGVNIEDVAVLPGGKSLVALGEVGVLLLSREGATLHHFDQPASALVLSSRGDRALALAHRGSATRIARLDLQGLRSAPWTEAPLTAWSPEFDGGSWVVGLEGGTLVEIDTLSPGWRPLWQLREPRWQVRACVARPQGQVSAVMTMNTTGEVHRLFFAPSARTGDQARELRHRQELPRQGPQAPLLLAWCSLGLLRWATSGHLELWHDAGVCPVATFPFQEGDTLRAQDTTLLFASRERAEVWRVGWSKPGREAQAVQLARVMMPGARSVVARPSSSGLALSDGRGRVVHLQETPGPGAAPRLLRTFSVR
ncbi:MAG: bpX6 domain-containing protein [Polyangiaceae bacterium]|nr:bpX6 domain-containing protein [Polyangiaceae bacterium]